jgi:hypothetical protein
MLIPMGSTREVTARPTGIGHVFRASIALGIGDDDTIGTVTSSVHVSESAARGWVEDELPRARFPEWVGQRQHGTAGAFLYGQIERGWYADGPDTEQVLEPDLDAQGWDADLIDGTLRWLPSH